MTLEQAVLDFEEAHTEDKSIPTDTVLDVCSGGVRLKGAPVPALYASADDAIDEWLAAIFQVSIEAGGEEHPAYRWIERPTLQKYQITIMDATRTHRIASDRYAVESRIVFR